MTDELKPVAIVELSDYIALGKPRKVAVRELSDGALVLGDSLYAIPLTHRVVSVADLYDALNCIVYSGHYGNTDADSVTEKIRAIIDNPAEGKEETSKNSQVTRIGVKWRSIIANLKWCRLWPYRLGKNVRKALGRSRR